MDVLILLSRILCWGTLLMMLLTIIKSPPGLLGGMIWAPKLWASAWSPVITTFAFLGAIMAAAIGQYFSMSM